MLGLKTSIDVDEDKVMCPIPAVNTASQLRNNVCFVFSFTSATYGMHACFKKKTTGSVFVQQGSECRCAGKLMLRK